MENNFYVYDLLDLHFCQLKGKVSWPPMDKLKVCHDNKPKRPSHDSTIRLKNSPNLDCTWATPINQQQILIPDLCGWLDESFSPFHSVKIHHLCRIGNYNIIFFYCLNPHVFRSYTVHVNRSSSVSLLLLTQEFISLMHMSKDSKPWQAISPHHTTELAHAV